MALYKPEIFDVTSLELAKGWILTPEEGISTEERWLKETPWTAQAFIDQCGVKPNQVIIDYGCGVGRLAKEVLRRIDVQIIGVDISANMMKMATEYVSDPRFSVVHRDLFIEQVDTGHIRAHHGYAVYVLQHAFDPAQDIRTLSKAVDNLFFLNNAARAVPVHADDAICRWATDGVDVADLCAKAFKKSSPFALDYTHITNLPVGLVSTVFSHLTID